LIDKNLITVVSQVDGERERERESKKREDKR